MVEAREQVADRKAFLQRFAGVAEHSPWVAETLWDEHPDAASAQRVEPLVDAFGKVIRSASAERRLALLQAHPELAVGVAAGSELTEASRREQTGAGLDRCSPEEFLEFKSLNQAYQDKFGFPFIIAVKGLDRSQILERFRDRIERSPQQEFSTAIENVIRIVGYRIEQLSAGHA